MKNTLTDLNNYLFEQMERLQDDSLDEAQFEKELKRTKGVAEIATAIIDNGNLALKARKYMDDNGGTESIDVPLLGIIGK